MRCIDVTNGNSDCGALAMVDTSGAPDRCVCMGNNVVAFSGTECVAGCNHGFN